MRIVKFYGNVALCVCETDQDWKIAIQQITNNLPFLGQNHDQAFKTLANICQGKVFFPTGYLRRILGHEPSPDEIF